ncbi:LL-diaminopimelate aminotransferase [Bacteroidia bacterium]|nr:LL-diaminopimelate aminotransferase [Bacteroidia bacterium]GHT82418.1 LL-diaminopimelate aminotransferase [Bacteroidia bacterium]
MALVNENFLKLPGNYLFAEIANRVNAYKAANPTAKVISLGIGDVTQPLAPAVIAAMQKATQEMAAAATMRGYAPDRGYPFLLEAIVKNDFATRGIDIHEDEVFVSDGAKSDTGNIGDILSTANVVAVTDPVYPVYVDTNVMGGRAGELQNGVWSRIQYLPCTAANNFISALPTKKVDVVYLCYPNNPTGTTLKKPELKKWVDYARQNDVLILFDAAYESYISEPDVPHSIYEIEGAKEVAVEFRSFSKTAGFTGVRCAYTVIPKALKVNSASEQKVVLNDVWKRRQATKFNGAPYVVQRAAEAVYSPEGKQQIRTTIGYYMENARIIKTGLEKTGMTTYGGVNAPYIWVQTPAGETSWSFFDKLLHQLQLVCTPGAGFGASGEGFVRLTAFGNRANTLEAVERIMNNG